MATHLDIINVACKMCGSRDASITYVRLGSFGRTTYYPMECLRRICRCCGYEWGEATLEARNRLTITDQVAEKA